MPGNGVDPQAQRGACPPPLWRLETAAATVREPLIGCTTGHVCRAHLPRATGRSSQARALVALCCTWGTGDVTDYADIKPALRQHILAEEVRIL